MKSDSVWRENSPAQHISLHMLDAVCERSAVRSVCLFAKTSIKWMAYKPLTLRRPTLTNTGCELCGFEEKDSRRRTKLDGKVSDLRNRICGVLDIPLSSINVDSYICSDCCFRSLKRFEKLQEDTKTLHRTLKENFVRNKNIG